jgi:hypothetical protein
VLHPLVREGGSFVTSITRYENELVDACSTHEREEKCVYIFDKETLREEPSWQIYAIDERIILKLAIKKWAGSCGLLGTVLIMTAEHRTQPQHTARSHSFLKS